MRAGSGKELAKFIDYFALEKEMPYGNIVQSLNHDGIETAFGSGNVSKAYFWKKVKISKLNFLNYFSIPT